MNPLAPEVTAFSSQEAKSSHLRLHMAGAEHHRSVRLQARAGQAGRPAGARNRFFLAFAPARPAALAS